TTEYVATFMKSGSEVGENDPIPTGWHRVTVTQDDTIQAGTVAKKFYAVEANGKLDGQAFPSLTGKAAENYRDPAWYDGQTKVNNPSDQVITKDTTLTAKAVQKDNAKYTPRVEAISKKYGKATSEADVKNAVKVPNFPTGGTQPTVTVDGNQTLPDGQTAGTTTVKATVTYPDGSTDPVTVTVTVGQATTAEVIPYLPSDPEPTEGKDGNPIPSNYLTLTFKSEDKTKGKVKVGEKTGEKVLAKVKPGTDLTSLATPAAEAGYGFVKWTPELGKATA
ncbi:hypothetical protein C3L56_08015, partial [Veillonellaceae bacterium M2-4]|nr:hypothetical protein [Veillonellaceae bacterium M2-4]